MQHEPLKNRAAGQWHGILGSIGIPSKTLRNKHGPCPMCGGKDRFRFDDKDGRGTWICSQCGAGDGIELVKQYLGVDFKVAAVEIEKHIGTVPVLRAGRPAENDGQKREEMAALWKRGVPITLDDVAGQYLHARTGLTAFPSCLRFSGDERYAEAGAKTSWHPAMIAAVMPSDTALAAGETAALHRTYLSREATKAAVSSPRKMLGSMPRGAAVRLMEHEDTLGIAEGIETALSASALYNVPCWAALTAGLLQEWRPPAGVRHVFVFGDNDVSMTGQAAAWTLAARLKTKGLDVLVELPPRVGEDWNDVHRQKREAAHRLEIVE